MAATAGIGRAGDRRWLAAALVLSLAVNMVLIGTAGGLLLRYSGDLAGSGAPPLIPNLLGYASTLPEERRKELWMRTESERTGVRPLRRALREAREEYFKALVAEPFDPQRFAAAQDRLLEADRKARQKVHRLYAEIAASLTPAERRAFLPWREKQRLRKNLLDEPEQQAGGGAPR
jgi:uncharacterized membrane protein